MSISPDQVRNVWAGDVVRFSAPVGDLRRPSTTMYLLVVAAGAVATLAFIPGFSGPLATAAVIVFGVWGAALIAAELWSRSNRAKARQILCDEEPSDLGTLAAHCWLTPIIRRSRDSRFDAAEWIRRAGPDGPRLVIRDLSLDGVPADPAVFEEEPLDSLTERREGRRTWLWLFLALWGWQFLREIRAVWLGSADLKVAVAIGCFGIMGVSAASRLGLFGNPLTPISTAPGTVRVAGRRRSRDFSRADSVILIEPLGTSAALRVQVIRTDGGCASMRFPAGNLDPMLARLLSRWCWRDGAGKGCEDRPIRSSSPCLPAQGAEIEHIV